MLKPIITGVLIDYSVHLVALLFLLHGPGVLHHSLLPVQLCRFELFALLH